VKKSDPETTSPGSLLQIILADRNEFEAKYLKIRYLAFDRTLRIIPKEYKKSIFAFKKKRPVGVR
jgi:hypothetical protein